MKKYGLPLLIVAAAGVMIGLFAYGQRQPAQPPPKASNLPEQQFPELTRTHIKPGDQHEAYNSNPPSSGPHFDQPAPWGIVDPSKVEPDERYIHDLEHGGIWITYKPDLSQEDIGKLKSLVQNLPTDSQFNEVKVVLTPRAANDHPISVVAWTYVMNLDTVDGAKIRQFYLDHVNKGPEVVP